MDIFRLARQQTVQQEVGTEQAVTLQIWSLAPTVHDGFVGTRGHFLATIAAIKQLQRLHVSVTVEVMVCKSNISTLSKLLRFVHSLGVEVCLVLSLKEEVHILPRLELLPAWWELIPLELLRLCRFRGFPLCVLPVEVRAKALPVAREHALHIPVCHSCALRVHCPGIPRVYQELYGEVEVIPVEQSTE